jgi:ribosomal protein L11 methyltransferase
VSWQEVSFEFAASDLPLLECLLELAGACSIAISDAADAPLLEPAPGETPVWPKTVVKALFRAGTDLTRLASVLENQGLGARELDVRAVADADWVRASQEEIRPLRVGALRVTPADAPAGGRVPHELKLGMGLGFGTGRHPTTRLCLEWLATHPLEGCRVLDYGCGSGILALAALALGADRAFAVDVDPQALVATHENARLNSLEGRVWIGLPAELPAVDADIVVANIMASTLLELAPLIAGRVRPAGHLVLGGILVEQVQQVRASYAGLLTDFEVVSRDGWARLVATRPSR